MHLRDAFGHALQPWKFAAQKLVVNLDDVIAQIVERKFRWIVVRGAVIACFGLDLFNNGLRSDSFARASFFEGAPALATEINAETLKDAGATGAFGNEFTDGSFEKRCAGGGDNILMMTHK